MTSVKSMRNELIETRLKRLEAQMNSMCAAARERFKTWKTNSSYEEQFKNSFEAMRGYANALKPAFLRKMCATLLETRILTDLLIEAYKKGEFYGAILTGYGQEAIGIGLGYAMRREDWLARDHRNWSASIARGTPTLDFFLNHFMRTTGPTGGYDPNIHFCDISRNDLGFLASDMAMAAVLINGSVFVKNLEKAYLLGRDVLPDERIAGVAIFGDGASSNGLALAGMNFAKAKSLSILEIIHNNQISLGTSPKEQHGDIDLGNRGLSFEIPGITVDGDDMLEMHLAVYWFLHFVRYASHPALINAVTFRRHGHNESEDPSYIKDIYDESYLAEVMSQNADPLERAKKLCEDFGVFHKQATFIKLRDEIRKKTIAAYEEALAAPEPVVERASLRNAFIDPACDQSKELAAQHPYSDAKSRRISMKDAIQEALAEELAKNPLLCIIGEDIGFPKGGVFAVTHGLLNKYDDRIINSTLDEAAINGFVAGVALAGYPVVAEHQFLNFFLAGPSPIVTLASTHAFIMNQPMPITLRAPAGYAPSSNDYHESLRLEAMLAAAQGIKIIVPSTPRAAKGLTKSAIQDPDPVFIIEEMSYYSMTGEVPQDEYYSPLGTAEICRNGRDITLIAWGPKMLELALKCAERLAKDGTELTVIDLQTLVPWDRETVFKSVRETGRVIVLHEASKFMGFGAEISATIAEEMAFYSLKARIRRIAALNIPIPVHRGLEDIRLPMEADVISAAHDLMEES